jgi:hypothetical protein
MTGPPSVAAARLPRRAGSADASRDFLSYATFSRVIGYLALVGV